MVAKGGVSCLHRLGKGRLDRNAKLLVISFGSTPGLVRRSVPLNYYSCAFVFLRSTPVCLCAATPTHASLGATTSLSLPHPSSHPHILTTTTTTTPSLLPSAPLSPHCHITLYSAIRTRTRTRPSPPTRPPPSAPRRRCPGLPSCGSDPLLPPPP